MTAEVTTVAVVNLKPGTSKTTSSVFLAASFAAMGIRTALVDADPGRSAIRWQELCDEPFPFDLYAMATNKLYHQARPMVARGQWGAVVFDCPQLEDHGAIGRGALRLADEWCVPFAPAGIELDRTTEVGKILDEVDSTRDTPGRRWALLTRTNRRVRSKYGPDAQVARVMTRQGYRVFDEQVHASDGLYRQCFGTVPDPEGTPFPLIARQLREARYAATVA